MPQEPFILTYDDFGKELIAKTNELFKGTRAQIPTHILTKLIGEVDYMIDNRFPFRDGIFTELQDEDEVTHMLMHNRLSFVTTIYNDKSLRSRNIWPITPLQSEIFLKENVLPEPTRYWESLALILYDTDTGNPQITNPREALALKEPP